jgi:hypothetical protein
VRHCPPPGAHLLARFFYCNNSYVFFCFSPAGLPLQIWSLPFPFSETISQFIPPLLSPLCAVDFEIPLSLCSQVQVPLVAAALGRLRYDVAWKFCMGAHRKHRSARTGGCLSHTFPPTLQLSLSRFTSRKHAAHPQVAAAGGAHSASYRPHPTRA